MSEERVVAVRAETVEDTRQLGRRLGALLQPGDVVLLAGELGAGKTTFTQGVADGVGVRGPVTSPTFVLAHQHPTLGSGPALVHVDAYRLGDAAELDDLDLDLTTDEAVTIVEWGTGIADALSAARLIVHLDRPRGSGADETREIAVSVAGSGWEERWPAVRHAVLGGPARDTTRP